jgi:hypothetical protein
VVESSTHHRHWYESTGSGPFRQGDIFRGATIAWLPDTFTPHSENELNLVTANWIALEASCDLDQRRCTQVLLAAVLDADLKNLKVGDEKAFQQRLEVMRRGGYVTRFLLSAEPDNKFPLSFVEFNTRALVPLSYLDKVVLGTPVLRLKSPIREQFGNWVGGCFSRVGPENEALIPPFVKSLHDAQRLKAED